MSIPLTTLLERLPLSGAAPALLPDRTPPGVRYIESPQASYVAPTIALSGAPLTDAQVVVVAAPAAVGKSAFGEFVALRTGGVYWDLSQARVGNNYALGTLAASHGPQ